MNRFTALVIVVFISFASSLQAAWTVFPRKSTKADIKTYEFKDYLIFSVLTGVREWRKNEKGKDIPWVEIGYKFVSQVENPRTLFGELGQIEIEFLDKRGAVLLSTRLGVDQLVQEREYYGFAWIEEKKAKKIEKTYVRQVPSAEEMKTESKKSEPIADNQQVATPVPKEEIQTPVIHLELKPSNGLERSAVTNEEVQLVLAELDARPATSAEVPQLQGAVTEKEIKKTGDRLAPVGEPLTLTVHANKQLNIVQAVDGEAKTETKDKILIEKEFLDAKS